MGAVLVHAPRGQQWPQVAHSGAQLLSCLPRKPPAYELCVHHSLSNYYLPRPTMGGSGPQHPEEDRAVAPSVQGEVAVATSC